MDSLPKASGLILPKNNALAARMLLRAARKGALATLAEDGAPYVSLAALATDWDGAPVFLFSTLSDHAKNLVRSSRASLLVEAPGDYPNPQECPRATFMGTIAATDDSYCRKRFLAIHPEAARYADFGDFAFRRMRLERVHFVGGFARAVWLEASAVLAPDWAKEWVWAEEMLLSQAVSEDLSENTRPATIDCDGCDIAPNRASPNRASQRLAWPDLPVRIGDFPALWRNLSNHTNSSVKP